MRAYVVKDLMVPLEEYATVSEDASLLDAVLALETAQRNFDQARYRHRALLVLDENKRGIYGAGCVRKPMDVAGAVQDATAAALKAIQSTVRR